MEKLDTILKEHVASGSDTIDKLLGAAFVVVTKDEVLYSGAAGRIAPDEDSRPWDTDTCVWLASMTKLITSTCIMQIVESGKIGLDDDVRPLVPELAGMQILQGFDGDRPILKDNSAAITLRILLTHTLGLPYDVIDEDIAKWAQLVGRTDYCMTWNRNGFNTPLKFTPGTSWLYGPATDWAGVVLEALTGETLGAYMQRCIFDPLDMRDTSFWPDKLPQVADRCAAHVNREEDGTLMEGPAFPPKSHEMESGGAGLYSTAADYAKFLRGFLAGKLVSEQTLRLMFTPQLNAVQREALERIGYESGEQIRLGVAPEFPKGHPLDWGLAGFINKEDVDGKRSQGSMAWSGMANSRWWIDRERGIGAVLLTQLLPHGDPVVARLYDDLEKTLYGELAGKKHSSS